MFLCCCKETVAVNKCCNNFAFDWCSFSAIVFAIAGAIVLFYLIKTIENIIIEKHYWKWRTKRGY